MSILRKYLSVLSSFPFFMMKTPKMYFWKMFLIHFFNQRMAVPYDRLLVDVLRKGLLNVFVLLICLN